MEKIKNKYTLLNTFGCFSLCVCKSFKAWYVTLLYGAVITLFSAIFEMIPLCKTGEVSCYITGIALFFLYVLLFTLFYLYDLYQTVFKNTVFKIGDFIKIDKNKIKSVGILFLYFFCFILSAFISWKILVKPANPDWRIEFVYFTIFFIFCMLPVLAMRFSAFTAFYFNDYKIPSLKYLYKKTEGRSYIGIIGFLMILLILSVFNMYIHAILKGVFTKLPFPVTADVLETFCYVLVILFTFVVLLCFFEAQRQMMDEDNIEAEITFAAAEEKKNQKPNKKRNKAKKKSEK